DVRFVQQLERGALPGPAQALEHRIAAGMRCPRVEQLDDEIGRAHGLGLLGSGGDHVTGVPVDGHWAGGRYAMGSKKIVYALRDGATPTRRAPFCATCVKGSRRYEED